MPQIATTDGPYRHLLLAYDGSREGRLALKEGARLAQVSGSRVTLLAVVDTSAALAASIDAGGYFLPPDQTETVRAILTEGGARLMRMGLQHDVRLESGPPLARILEVARELSVDLVVIGHQTKGAMSRWFSTSLASELADALPCSLLVARHDIPDETLFSHARTSAPMTKDRTDLDDAFQDARSASTLRAEAPDYHDAARSFWAVAFRGTHLGPRLTELAYFAMHASASALNPAMIERHGARVLAAGGTRADLLDVLITIVGLANHAVYAAVPLLEEEWAKTGRPSETAADDDPRLVAAKERFVAIRNFWNPERESIARAMPDYYAALTDVSTATWKRGSLTRKERELMCIAIDCNLTHSYPPGLRIHIRNAIREGASREEILEVFQLAGVLGLEGYVLAADLVLAQGEGA